LPPFCSPFICPDIDADVDPGSAEYPVACWGYKVLVLNWITFFVNFIGAGAYAHAGSSNSGKFEYIGLSVVFVIFGIPVSECAVLADRNRKLPSAMYDSYNSPHCFSPVWM